MALLNRRLTLSKAGAAILGLFLAGLLLGGCIKSEKTAVSPELMIVGLDQKVTWNDQGVLFGEGGSDRVVIYDISDRLKPVEVVNLNLSNSVFGPPVNLAIAPNQQLALVADSTVHVPVDGGGWTWEPTNGLHILDLIHSADCGRTTRRYR